MKEETLKRLLSLIEKTGDRMVITDPAGEHPYVLMSLEQYERLIGSTTPPVPGTVAVPGTSEKPAEPKKQLMAAGKFRMPMQDGDLGTAADFLKAAAARKPNPAWKPQLPRTQAPKPAREPAMAALDTEGEEQFFLEPLE